MTRVFEENYIRRCCSLVDRIRCESSAFEAKSSLGSGSGRGKKRKELARGGDCVESCVSLVYIYISAVTPLSEKILPPGTLVAGNKRWIFS